jgi:hypothetical protein
MLSYISSNDQMWGTWPLARQKVQCYHQLSAKVFYFSGAHIFKKKMKCRLTSNHPHIMNINGMKIEHTLF